MPVDPRSDGQRPPRHPDRGRALRRPVECEGFEARCVLHEIDHLDGILFLDRVESLVDDVFRRKTYAPPPGEPGGAGRPQAQ
jgi:hypothetical protein